MGAVGFKVGEAVEELRDHKELFIGVVADEGVDSPGTGPVLRVHLLLVERDEDLPPIGSAAGAADPARVLEPVEGAGDGSGRAHLGELTELSRQGTVQA